MLTKPLPHDPATYWAAYHLNGHGRSRAKDGYICYAVRGCPSNSAYYGPGFGLTERDALLAACYWSNQSSYVRVVPVGEAPAWAREQARSNNHE